jgi:hypothetical protein
LFIAFNGKNLRMDTFNGIIIKYETSNCRNLNILNTLIAGSMEN